MRNIISCFISFCIVTFIELYFYYEISDIIIYDNSYKSTICYSQYNYWLSYEYPNCIFFDILTYPLYESKICYIKDCIITFEKPYKKSYVHKLIEMKINLLFIWLILEFLSLN